MPAVEKSLTEKRKARSRACMERYMKLNGIEISNIAKRMNVAEQTVYRWLKKPEKLQLEDLWQIATVLKCPIGELCGGELPEELIGKWLAAGMKAM